MWDFYLAGSEAAFRHDTFVVFQLQLGRRMDAAPPARDTLSRGKMPTARYGLAQAQVCQWLGQGDGHNEELFHV